MSEPLFDQYADEYERALEQGISISGQSRDYFARKRVEKLVSLLQAHGPVERVLDFGCGTGDTLPYLTNCLSAREGLGVDVSSRSIDRANKLFGDARNRFRVMDDCPADASFDLAYCNGVFHHIPLAERSEAYSYVWNRLKPGGYFALCENNPWNPGTVWIMKRIPFDRDAITISIPEAQARLRESGFHIVQLVNMFLFPKSLRALSFMERCLLNLPIGAQYMVLAQKPV